MYVCFKQKNTDFQSDISKISLYVRWRKNLETVGTDAGKLPPLAKEMTWNEIRNYMSGIRMVYDGKGGRRWMEITRRQHAIAERLGFPNAYRKLPEWGPE